MKLLALLAGLALAGCGGGREPVERKPVAQDTASAPLMFLGMVGAGDGVAYAYTMDELYVIRGDTARRVVVEGQPGRRIEVVAPDGL